MSDSGGFMSIIVSDLLIQREVVNGRYTIKDFFN